MITVASQGLWYTDDSNVGVVHEESGNKHTEDENVREEFEGWNTVGYGTQ